MQLLIIEDDNEIREMLADIIRDRLPKVDIAEARNGLEGFNKVNRIKPDIVITDLAMPEMNGLELIKLLEIKGNKAPLYIFSGRTEFRMLAEKFTNVSIFEKPGQMNDLIEKVVKQAS